MCLPSRPRPTPAPPPRRIETRPTAESSPTADRMSGRVERTPPPAPPRVNPPAPTPPPTPPAPQEPEPKMRAINRTVAPGTTVRGQQRTESAAPSRRRRRSTRVGRRFGTSSLRIARNPNTGTGNLNY